MNEILLFDDRPQVRNSLAEKFEFRGFKVFPCRTIYEANDIWVDKKNDLDVIVVDMMMPSSGIDESLRPLTKDGLLSGWIWLWNVLNPEKKEPHPATDMCIVIYSAYLEDFQEYINESPDDKEKKFAKQVTCIPKGSGDQEDKVIEYVIQYLNQKAVPNK